jgi:hypothetical protein
MNKFDNKDHLLLSGSNKWKNWWSYEDGTSKIVEINESKFFKRK